MSARPSSAVRSLSGAVRAPYSSARRSALPAVRLTTVTLAAPSRKTVAVASPAIEPAPTTTTRLPSTSRTGGTGAGERGGDQRRGGPVDVGLGARALADAQRLLEERVERRARRCRAPGPGAAPRGSGRGSGPRRRPSSRGRRRRGRGARRRRRRSGRRGAAGSRSTASPARSTEQPGDVLDAAVEAVDVGVDLEPVAGGDHRRLGDVLAGGGLVDQLVHAARRRGRPARAGRPGRSCGRCPRPGRSCGAPAESGAQRAVASGEAHAVASPCALRCSW